MKENQVEEREIKNFTLNTSMLCHIVWMDGDKERRWYVNLYLSDILKIIEIEGLSFEDILKMECSYKPLVLKNVTLKSDYTNNAVEAGFFDQYEGNTLHTDGCWVEMLRGDSFKNHKHDVLCAIVGIKED